MPTYQPGTITVWVRANQQYPYSTPDVITVYKTDPGDLSLPPNERIIKVDIAIPQNFFKPVEYVTTVDAELPAPIMLDATQDRHSAFN